MDQPSPDCEAHQPGGIVNIQLPHDPGPVAVGCLDTDSEDRRNLLRRLSFRDELKDLTLAGAQHVARRVGLVEGRLDNGARDGGTQVHSVATDFANGRNEIRGRLRLHDEAGQLLVSVYLALDTLAAEWQPEARGRLIEIRARLEQVEAQLRRLSHELRPTILDDLGLKPAIEFLADGIAKRTGRAVVVTGSTGGRLSGPVETAMYRIVQEALTNVTKHAHATQAVVRLERRPGALVCSIADNGRGFDASARSAQTHSQGLGLIGMRERAASLDGTLSIHSSPGKGTRLKIVVPLKGETCRSESSSLTTT